jgi:hypothetical protein
MSPALGSPGSLSDDRGMVEIELAIAPVTDAEVEEVIERCCAAAGLRTQLKGTLAAYPGSVHWHFKRGREPGTLEVTWWPRERRAWISVHANRGAPWVEELLPELAAAIEDGCQPR